MDTKHESANEHSIGTCLSVERQKKGLSRQAVADYVGVALSTMQAWEKDEREPNASGLIKLTEILDISVNKILFGVETEQPSISQPVNIETCSCVDVLGNPVDLSEFVFVPRYDVRAAAGHGAWNDEEKPQFTMAFRRYWIENFLRVSPKDLSVISVKGDSMEGVLNDRDSILINHADNDPKEGVYVLRIDGHLVVKRIQRLPGEVLKVSSTNPAYEPFTVDMKSPPQDFNVIGKVVWFGRMM